jgi:integrase
MSGCRALTEAEVSLISRSFGGRYAARDRALFVVGVWTGYRISELLSLCGGDVWQHGRVVDVVTVARRHMKGKQRGRSMVLHPEAKAALTAWIRTMPVPLSPETYLFRSREGQNRPLQRVQAWQILRDAYETNQLQGQLGSHSMRKTFAARLYAKTHDIKAVQRALGHRFIATTDRYLESITDEALFKTVLSL